MDAEVQLMHTEPLRESIALGPDDNPLMGPFRCWQKELKWKFKTQTNKRKLND